MSERELERENVWFSPDRATVLIPPTSTSGSPDAQPPDLPPDPPDPPPIHPPSDFPSLSEAATVPKKPSSPMQISPSMGTASRANVSGRSFQTTAAVAAQIHQALFPDLERKLLFPIEPYLKINLRAFKLCLKKPLLLCSRTEHPLVLSPLILPPKNSHQNLLLPRKPILLLKPPPLPKNPHLQIHHPPRLVTKTHCRPQTKTPKLLRRPLLKLQRGSIVLEPKLIEA